MKPLKDVYFNYSIPPNVQKNIRKLLSAHPNGIWSYNIEKEYKNAFNEELTFKKYGCGSIKHMCVCLYYTCQMIESLKDFKVFAVNTTIPNDILTSQDKNIISTVVHVGAVIARDQLPATNDLITIKITQVHDPSKFWFYTAQNENKLNTVMQQMQIFYNSQPSAYYKVAPYELIKDLYCAVPYCDQFHRAIIIDLVPELLNSVKVYYIDYGTVDLADTSKIYYLHQSFEAPSALAIRGRIAFIKPVGLNMPWASSVTYAFEQMIMQKSVQAQIESTIKEGTEYSYILKLYDKTSAPKFWIHDRLLERDDVIGKAEEQDESKSIPEFINNKCMMHLVPSFEELETGVAPNTDVLYCMEEFNYPLHRIFQRYLQLK